MNRAWICLFLSGCSAAPMFHPSCNAPYDADPRGIQQRVLAAHPRLAPASVLRCASTETGTGFSTDPDQEACKVVLDKQANANELTAFYSSKPMRPLPTVVSKLAGETSLTGARGTFSAPVKDGPLLFETSKENVAILYAPYMRCVVLEEVT